MMPRLPTVITSSVIRGSQKGDSHGGLYIVDLESGGYQQVLDWDVDTIDWSGMGAERGLRGIALYGGLVYLASGDLIHVFDRDFGEQIESHHNKYLTGCHEIFAHDGILFISSCGYDSVLLFDVTTKKFIKGYCLRGGSLSVFDPEQEGGPSEGNTLHVNSVYYQDGACYVSGAHSTAMYRIEDDVMTEYAWLPMGNHNGRPFKGGILYNSTRRNNVVYLDRHGSQSWAVPSFDDSKLLFSRPPRIRPRWARGLCVMGDLIIGGCSPATISVYRLGYSGRIKSVTLTMDVRNVIHGLEVWEIDG